MIELTEKQSKNLVSFFSDKIFKQGLFAEANKSDMKTLVSDKNNISVSSLWMCGVIMVTIAEGEDVDANYHQITFAAHTDDPYTTLYLRSYEGTYSELFRIIDEAKDRFLKSNNVMKHKPVVYAGFKIGE